MKQNRHKNSRKRHSSNAAPSYPGPDWEHRNNTAIIEAGLQRAREVLPSNPRVLYYDQSTGHLIHNGEVIARAVSGRDAGFMNGDLDMKGFLGPIPKGGYAIEGKAIRKNGKATIGMVGHKTPGVGIGYNLMPDDTSLKRNGFVMHAGHLKGKLGSFGCITFDDAKQLNRVAEYIQDHDLRRLEVYDSKKVSPKNDPILVAQAKRDEVRLASLKPMVPSPSASLLSHAAAAMPSASAQATSPRGAAAKPGELAVQNDPDSTYAKALKERYAKRMTGLEARREAMLHPPATKPTAIAAVPAAKPAGPTAQTAKASAPRVKTAQQTPPAPKPYR